MGFKSHHGLRNSTPRWYRHDPERAPCYLLCQSIAHLLSSIYQYSSRNTYITTSLSFPKTPIASANPSTTTLPHTHPKTPKPRPPFQTPHQQQCPPPSTNIALIGATGNLGPHILDALHTHPSNFHLTILTRKNSTTNPLPFPSSLSPSIRIIHAADYTPDFLHQALTGIDAVVLSLAAAALGEQKGIIDACVRAGVRRVVLSEWGSDTTNPLAIKAVPFCNAKLEVVEYAKKVVAEQQPEGVLSWSAVVTGPFYDWCLKLGFFAIDVKNKKVTLYDEGKGVFNTTTLSKIGASVAALLARPTKYANSYIFISSFTTSQAVIFAAVKAASGTKDTDWTIENKSTEACMQEGREKAAQGDIHGTYDLIFGSIFGGSKYGSDYGNRREISNEELGLEEEDLESVTREVLEGKRPQVEW